MLIALFSPFLEAQGRYLPMTHVNMWPRQDNPVLGEEVSGGEYQVVEACHTIDVI